MAGAACKVIINNGTRALSESLETILTDPNIHQGKIPDADRRTLIQALADIDIAALHGDGGKLCAGGLVGLVRKLETYGLISPDVWALLAAG